MKSPSLVAGLLLACSGGAVGFRAPNGGPVVGSSLLAVPPQVPASGVRLSSGEIVKRDPDSTFKFGDVTVTEGVFHQLIDHTNPGAGTFPQRIWWSADHWAGPQSPVIVMTPGIHNGSDYTGYASNLTLTGVIAQAVGGAVIVYEGRFSGESTPFTEYTTANLSHLTIQNMISDGTYLAKNIQLPWEPTGRSGPGKAPWLLVSGGLGGTLSAWTSVLDPGTYWAHLASSTSVQSFRNYYQYFDVVQTYGRPNCTADVVKVIDYVDNILENGTPAQIQSLKEKFGFGELPQAADFVNALSYGPASWQDQEFRDEHYNNTGPYYQFCDYVENVWPGSGNKVPGAEGVGLEKALEGYAKWSRDWLIPGSCDDTADYFGAPEYKGKTNVKCFDTYNASAPWYTNRSSVGDGHGLPGSWLQCNEPMESWGGAPPKGRPSLVSRLIDEEYYLRQCNLMFPPQNGVVVGINAGKTVADLNKVTGGWNAYTNAKRIIFSDGEADPIIESNVAAKGRPGGPQPSTDQVPILTVPGGNFCPDLLTDEENFNAGVKAVRSKEVAIMKAWVQEFYKEHGIHRDFEY